MFYLANSVDLGTFKSIFYNQILQDGLESYSVHQDHSDHTEVRKYCKESANTQFKSATLMIHSDVYGSISPFSLYMV